MKTDLAIHELTEEKLQAFIERPSHALMLVGPTGGGKLALAMGLTEALLKLEAGSFDKNPYCLIISRPQDKRQITIEAIRQLEHFLALKVPSKADPNRIVIIEDAHLLGHEAQNALLKTFEEPPVGTVIILTVSHEQALLPTIRSRAATIQVGRPDRAQLNDHFASQRHQANAIDRAYDVSGGLPGLMQALLTDDQHQLKQATEWARKLLSQSPYDRLLAVDQLARDKQLAADVVFILQQMASLSLQTATGLAATKWQKVLEAAYVAAEALQASAQPKLVLCRLMLNL